MAVARPAAPLRPFVERYSGYRLEGLPPGVHRGLPSRHLTVVISLGSPVEVVGPGPARSVGSFQALAGGLHATAAGIEHDGRQHGVHLDLTPLGARSLLGLPPSALASTVVDFDELLGSASRELVDRLAEAPDWPRRFAVIDEVLTRSAATVRRPAPPAPELARAWRRLTASEGLVRIDDLAADVGWSRRHLSERFRREFGLAPKVVARVLRFERSRRLLQHPRRPGLAEVAATCGYFDQAHLIRDWHDFAGCTPTTWMAEELPPVGIVRAGDGAVAVAGT